MIQSKALLKNGLLFNLLILIAGITVLTQPAQSQNYFEGTLIYNVMELENGELAESGAFTLVCNKDRMRFFTDSGKTSTEMLPGVESDQILIRHDKQDFVIFTGEKEALSISKSDIQGLFGMFRAFMGNTDAQPAPQEPKGNLNRTGQTATLNGIRANQWIYTDEDGEEVHFWLSETNRINWGMFREPWFSDLSTDLTGPFSKVIDDGYLPLKIEAYKDGVLQMVIRAGEVDRRRISNTELDVPAGVQVKTLQQMMMEQFQGGRN